jgi:protoheme IX farnesyltransferase
MKALAIASRQSAAMDFLELTKPRLSVFVLVVVLISGWLAAPTSVLVLFAAVVGTGLVAGGANALNMLIERDYDAKMHRTANRPLPAGRLMPREVMVFGLVLGFSGVILLAAMTTVLAAGIAAFNLICYVGIYTPLKRRTTLNTHVGAVPGALPALIGAAAVTGTITPAAWMLFFIVYLWQLPHFLSIAWLYREDYERGGFLMLSVVDKDGFLTGRQAVLGALALIPVSLLPVQGGVSGIVYLIGALALGLFFLGRAIAFAIARTSASARLLMRASLLYLPLVLTLMLLDRL